MLQIKPRKTEHPVLSTTFGYDKQLAYRQKGLVPYQQYQMLSWRLVLRQM